MKDIQMAKKNTWKDDQHYKLSEKCKLKPQGNITTHHTQVSMMKKTQCWQECGGPGTFVDCWWKCKIIESLCKQFGSLLKL